MKRFTRRLGIVVTLAGLLAMWFFLIWSVAEIGPGYAARFAQFFRLLTISTSSGA